MAGITLEAIVFAISIETPLVNRKFGNVHIQTIF